jgi:ABC-2 type transport system ATP-binding protein
MSFPAPILELTDLGMRYGSKQVLEGLHLALRPGSICAILGRNGAGKTTTIQLIMGHLHPTRGEVRILGKDIRFPESHEVWRRVGYVPDQPVLYDHLTGREFLHFIGEIYGVARTEFTALDEVATSLGFLPDIDNLIRTYSLGTKKKLAFLAATLHDPEILILDEPIGSIDAVSTREVRRILKGFRERGKLVVFSTHAMDEAERLSDRISILHEGVLRFDGTPDQLRSSFGGSEDESLEEIFIRLTAQDSHSLIAQDACGPEPQDSSSRVRGSQSRGR